MHWTSPWTILLITAAVYLNSLPGALFWDSEVLILNNVFLRSFRHLPEIFTTSVTAGGGEINNYYRPIPVTLLLAEYQLWGPRPLGYHAVSLLLHMANAAMVFLLAQRLAGRRTAFWAALLFALHPIQNETVNYADHVEGLLAFFFGALTLLFYDDGRRGLSLLPWSLCLLSKEEGVVFLPILLLWELLSSRERKQPLRRPWPHGLLFGLYAALHLSVFNFLELPLTQFGAQKGAYAGLGLRLLTFAKAFAVYMKLLILPAGLHFDRDLEPVRSYLDSSAWLAAAAGAGLLALLWKSARESPQARLGILWFLAGLAPYCGLLPFNNILAEHFLYVSSAGLFLAAAALGRRIFAGIPAPAKAAALAALFSFYGVQNFRRNRDWQDPVRIYQSTLRGNPKSFRAANNLGVEQYRKGLIEDACASFLVSLKTNPDYHPALNNMGAVEEARGRLEEALEWYCRSSRADPDYALARKNLAGVHLRLGRFREAELQAREALRIYPEYPEAKRHLELALKQQRR